MGWAAAEGGAQRPCQVAPSPPTSPSLPVPLPERRLRAQLQWRYACYPEQSACCEELPASGYLATAFGLRGLVPLSEASCKARPGCLPETWCWAQWGRDSCSQYGADACRAQEHCQVGRPGGRGGLEM